MDQRTTFLIVARRYGLVVLLVAAAVAAGSYALSGMREPRYRTAAAIALGEGAQQGIFGDVVTVDRARRIAVEERRATSAPVLIAAAERLGAGTTEGDVERAVDTSADFETDRIQVTAEAGDAARAAAIATAVVDAYREAVGTDYSADSRARLAELEQYIGQLEGQRDAADAQLAAFNADFQAQVASVEGLDANRRSDMLRRLQTTTPEYDRAERASRAARDSLTVAQREAEELQVDAELVAAERIDAIEPAELPEEPVSPRPQRDAALAGVLALLVAGALAWRRADHLPRPVPADAVPGLLGAPTLGVVPEQRQLRGGNPVARAHDPSLPAAEAYQLVSACLRGPLAAHGIKAVLVTSASRREGRTTTALNLAAASALGGRRVVVVDADLRSRGLSTLCGARERPGLGEAIASGALDAGLLLDLPVGDGETVRLLPAGAPAKDVARVLSSGVLRDVLRQVAADADLVIVDGPPLVSHADATLLADAVGGVIIVTSRDVTDEVLEAARVRLGFLNVPVLGAVRNDMPRRGEGRRQAGPRLQAARRDVVPVER